MSKNIVIKSGNLKVSAKLNDSKTAGEIFEKLPLESRVNTWGDEIYFNIPVMADIEEGFSKEVVEMGDLGYWPQGPAFCIFFGPTPVSKPGEIRPATAVNVIGKISGDPKVFKKIKDAETITIEEES